MKFWLPVRNFPISFSIVSVNTRSPGMPAAARNSKDRARRWRRPPPGNATCLLPDYRRTSSWLPGTDDRPWVAVARARGMARLALAQLAALVLSVATFAPFAVSSRRAQGVLSTSAIVVDPAKDTLVDAAAQLARALSYLLR